MTANQTDTNGNSSEFSKAAAFADLPPDTLIDSGPAAGSTTNDATPTLSFSSSEPSSNFECKIDGGAFDPCVSPDTIGPLGDGDHTFQVRAIDSNANTDASPASRTFAVDTAAPETQIDSGPPDGSTTADTIQTFGFSANDSDATFECRVDGEPFAACSGPGSTHTTASLAEGQHTFEVRSTDAVGNVDATPATRTFTVDLPDPPAPPPDQPTPPPTAGDKDPPETSIDKAPKAKTSKRKAKFGFSSDESGSHFECMLDKGDFEPCAASPKFKVKPGKHTLQVRAIDPAGNVDATPAQAKWKVRR